MIWLIAGVAALLGGLSLKRAIDQFAQSEPRPTFSEPCRHLNSQTAYRSGVVECDDCGERVVDPYAARRA